jgi:hypothetical protein
VSQLKVGAFCSSRKNECRQNTSAYTQDIYCHLWSDEASLHQKTPPLQCMIICPHFAARWQHMLWLFSDISVEYCPKDSNFPIISVEYCQILLICLNFFIKYCSNWLLGWRRDVLSKKSLLASFCSNSLMKNDQNLQLIEHFLSMQDTRK